MMFCVATFFGLVIGSFVGAILGILAGIIVGITIWAVIFLASIIYMFTAKGSVDATWVKYE